MSVFSPFAFLRRKVAEAVILGTADGLKAVLPDEGEQPPTDLDGLRQLLATAAEPKALSAKSDDEEEPVARRKRA